MKAVRADLESAGRLDSFAGQLAVRLAQQLANAGSAGAVGLSRELRTAMAEALGYERPATPPVVEAGPSPAEPEDEVSAARRRAAQIREGLG